ncbi:transcriptional regulatory protein DEP1 [Seiridium cupressi]
MATGDTAPPLSIQPPAIEPLSDDDGSSPLSDLGGSQNDLELPDESPNAGRQVASDDEGNDTEAETERLYPTPHNPTRHTDALDGASTLERTPTKLRPGTRVDDDEDEPLSELQGSFTSSPPRAHSPGAPTVEKLPSPTLDILAEAAAAQDSDIRKRKRSSLPPDLEEEDQPSRKRSASAPAIDQADQDGDVVMADDDGPSTNTNSGDEAVTEPRTNEGRDEPADEADADAQAEEESRARKQARGGSKKRKTPRAESDEPAEEAVDGATAEEEGAHTGDDEHNEADVDEEAEAAQRTEEELERKRAALDGLNSIEKQFALFRERLYQERLDQLNREEAMLKADNPTHPDYLAMMECIDSRRDEKLRVAEKEHELNTETLGRWAVARRAQILSQYYQDVRETRERVLGELGQYWYAIQHERRKHANNVHDYGLRFPQAQTQRVRDAMAYNKEVAILSGIAKYEGMPAAPDMRGASSQDFDDDFEAMNRGRGSVPQAREPTRSVYSDIRGIPFGQGLGAAAEQFIEQNAWANPHHPSNAHLLQRQHSQQEPRRRSPLPEASGSRRHSHQPNPFSSSTISSTSNYASYNGNTATSNHVPRAPTTSPETTRAASLLEQTSVRSMKAAAAAAAAAAEAEQSRAVKREAAPPVGGF